MRILYLDLDALTPSHLSCYGYTRPTSPAIDAVADQGVRFTRCYAADAPCLPSRTGLYSGRFGIQSGVVGHGHVAAQPKVEPQRRFRDHFTDDGLAGRLRAAGLHTAMISPFGDRHSAHWFYAGFNEIHNTGKHGREIAAEVTPVVEKWLSGHAAGDDWFLHVNYWDIHTPYRTPLDYACPDVTDAPLPDVYTDELIARHAAKGGPHSASDLGMYGDGEHEDFPRVPRRIDDRASLKQWMDGYDVAIRYVDDQVKLICDKLRAAGVYDETAILISADHGENHGELGIYGEHGTADHATCNVPLIVKWPGGAAGKVEDALHYQLDLAPTLAELMGFELPAIWDGESYAEAVRTGQRQGHEQLVLSQCAHVCQRSVRWADGPRDWLYMRTYQDGFHLFPQEMLYDLATDPLEQDDLADENPDVLREGAHRLMDWHDAQMQKMLEFAGDSVDPLWTVLRDGGPFHAQRRRGTGQPTDFDAYLQRLRDTGRGGFADRLLAKYP